METAFTVFISIVLISVSGVFGLGLTVIVVMLWEDLIDARISLSVKIREYKRCRSD